MKINSKYIGWILLFICCLIGLIIGIWGYTTSNSSNLWPTIPQATNLTKNPELYRKELEQYRMEVELIRFEIEEQRESMENSIYQDRMEEYRNAMDEYQEGIQHYRNYFKK